LNGEFVPQAVMKANLSARAFTFAGADVELKAFG
jgi:hypothetical protein